VADKVWTAAELEQMSPTEIDALFRASIVWDLDDVPPEFLTPIREATLRHIAENEV
jgi:hypothetical protein